MANLANKPLHFHFTIMAEVKAISYIEIAERQKKFEEAVDRLRQDFDVIELQVKQKRARKGPAPERASQIQRRRQPLQDYDEL
jgi:hypothetical protein